MLLNDLQKLSEYFQTNLYFIKSSPDPYDQSDSAPLRRSSSRSSAGGNYQDPNSMRRNGSGERSRVNIPIDSLLSRLVDYNNYIDSSIF